ASLTALLSGDTTIAMREKVLVVEDDDTLRETLVYNLTREGYDVSAASDGHSAVTIAREKAPDAIILDVMLPGIDGFEVCRVLRQELSTPILMLTARDDEVDKVVGLEVGADDYMTKPFSMRELMARVKALLRRVRLIREEVAAEQQPAVTGMVETDEPLVFDNLIIDLARREVRLDGQPAKLKPKEYELLLFLARNRGIALSRDLILDRVWGWAHDGGSRTVDVHVHWLREKIEPDPARARGMVTGRGIGYGFEG